MFTALALSSVYLRIGGTLPLVETLQCSRTVVRSVQWWVSSFGKYIIGFYYRLGFIQQQPKRKRIFNQPPIVSYKKEKSLKDILVLAKLASNKQQSRSLTNLKEIYIRSLKPTPNSNHANLAITSQLNLQNRSLITYFLTLIISITNVEAKDS